MIFGPRLLPFVLDGSKTQTRRPRSNRYKPGRTYAVQPRLAGNRGRGGKGVARIRVVDVREERVMDISEEDAVAEGFRRMGKDHSARSMFLEHWHEIHDDYDQTEVVSVIEFEVVADG